MINLKPYPQYKRSELLWVDHIPNHWDLVRNKVLFDIRKEIVGEKSSEFTLLSLTLNGIIKRDMINPKGKFPAEFNTYQIVREKDFVFCLFDVDETPRTIGVSPYNGMITGAYTVFKPRISNIQFLYYYYLHLDNSKALKPIYTGLRKVIPEDRFLRTKTPLPSIEEQQQIACYLDWKTSQIAKVIKAKKRMIELLKEQKLVIINDAVTGKVDVRTGKPYPKYKDSGVVWIGRVPIQWKILKLKFFASLAGRIGFHGLSSNDYKDQGITLVTGTDFRKGLIDWKNCHKIDESWYERDSNIQLKEGDLLITKDGTIGKTAIVKDLSEKAVLNSGIMVIRTKNNFIYNNDFLMYIINSEIFKRFIDLKKTGATVQHLYQDTFNNFIVAFPNLDDQIGVVKVLKSKIERIEKSITLLENDISLLLEYRITLIANVVIGKVDVRGIKIPEFDVENGIEGVEDTSVIEEDLEEATMDNDL